MGSWLHWLGLAVATIIGPIEAPVYLGSYANEMAWCEDNRRVPNGDLYMLVADAALAHSVSRQWKGYWQRKLG